MLYLGEVEDEGHTGDENEVEEAHGGKEMSHLSKIGTAKEHLEQHLDGERTMLNSPFTFREFLLQYTVADLTL